MVIGLTGGSGSGKTTAAKFFEKMGANVIDADKIGHEILKRGDVKEKIKEAFGSGVFDRFGEIDRKALGKIVFNDEKKRSLLNEITHTPIRDEILNKIGKKGDCVWVIDAALLFETNMDKACDIVLAITCPKELRVERIKNRDNVDEDLALKRINSQMSDEKLIKKSHYHIENNGSEEEFLRKLNDFWTKNVAGGC